MTILGGGAVTTARYRNALIGLAAGDAWGYQVEFTSYAQMRVRPVPRPVGEWVISDDTQMTLAVDEALSRCPNLGDIPAVTDALTASFISWQRDPDNDRAPGTACMTAVGNLRRGARWHDPNGATDSAGCGVVMRLTPAAFAPQPYWLGLTALQAVITHNHPMAVVAALILADATRHAAERHGKFLERALETAVVLDAGRSAWSEDPYLAEVLAPITDDVAAYLAEGVRYMLHDCLRSAADKSTRLRQIDPAQFGDPCADVGEGWESASAVALALLVADLATGSDAPFGGAGALGWASTSNGDSDSIACMAGAVIGAAHDSPDYWAGQGVEPVFEPRYAREIAIAAGRWAST